MGFPDKVIDAHIHFSDIQSFRDAAVTAEVDYSYEGYLREREACGIAASVCMGLAETAASAFPDKSAPAAMTADLHPERPPNLHLCLGINPYSLTGDMIPHIKKMLPGIVGFKIYAGYYHFHIHDPVYDPIYRLAAAHNLPVAIHTGDTYSERGLLKYSHPLEADQLAFNWRDVTFILCHMGEPWIIDGCEMAYKNRNVCVDISGLLTGSPADFAHAEKQEIIRDGYKKGLVYLNNYKKVLFGTDWPLIPMKPYMEYCKKLIPDYAYGDVFYGNAVRVYGLMI
jgi:hypothetical protein